MDTVVWIAIAVAAAVILLAVLVWIFARRHRSKGLRQRFRGEYDRTLERSDSRREAELDLRDRAKQRDKLEIAPLTRAARERYTDEWRAVQQRFVDEPLQAVADAYGMLTRVMRDRGYPVDDFDTRSDVVSVDHPAVVENYRTGHQVLQRARQNEASTEELRAAMVKFRSLFDELLVSDDLDGERRAVPDASEARR